MTAPPAAVIVAPEGRTGWTFISRLCNASGDVGATGGPRPNNAWAGYLCVTAIPSRGRTREEHMKRLCLLAAAATLFAAPAFAEDTITVGFTDSQTGPLNVNSLGQQRGYEFWRDEVNAAGGIKAGGKNYKVKFVSYDDQSVGGRVQQLYTRLINQDKARFPVQSLFVRADRAGSRDLRAVRQDHDRQRRRRRKALRARQQISVHGDHLGRAIISPARSRRSRPRTRTPRSPWSIPTIRSPRRCWPRPSSRPSRPGSRS